MRHEHNLPQSALGKRILAAAAASALAVTALAACTTPEDAGTDRTLSVAVSTLDGGGWDPSQVGIDTSNFLSVDALFDSLLKFDESGEAIPGLGLIEEYAFADDRLSLDATLREGVIFSDGEALTAAGVVDWFNFLIADVDYTPGALAQELGIEFVETGDLTFQMTATTPIFPPHGAASGIFRTLFMATPVLSPAAIDDPETALAEPLGSGPYSLGKFIPEIELTLERNPDYWNLDAFPFETIVLKLLTDPIAQLNALKSGQVDSARLAAEYVEEAEASGLEINTRSLGYYGFLFRNVENSTLEPLNDVRVREAIAIAFDRDAIADAIAFPEIGSTQAFYPGQPEYIEGADDRYAYDLERALDLMAEAGYSDGFDLVIPTTSFFAPLLPVITQSLSDIGVRVEFQFMPGVVEDFFPEMLSGDHPVNLFDMGYSQSLAYLDVESDGRFFDQNPELDELLSTIRTGDADAAAQASQELGEKLLDEVWYIPITSLPEFRGFNPDVLSEGQDGVWQLTWDFQLPE